MTIVMVIIIPDYDVESIIGAVMGLELTGRISDLSAKCVRQLIRMLVVLENIVTHRAPFAGIEYLDAAAAVTGTARHQTYVG